MIQIPSNKCQALIEAEQWMMRYVHPPCDVALTKAKGKERDDWHRKNHPDTIGRQTSLEMNVQGFSGELAVCMRTGLDRSQLRTDTPQGDWGIDLLHELGTVQVKAMGYHERATHSLSPHAYTGSDFWVSVRYSSESVIDLFGWLYGWEWNEWNEPFRTGRGYGVCFEQLRRIQSFPCLAPVEAPPPLVTPAGEQLSLLL